jgi:hypothetical protein
VWFLFQQVQPFYQKLLAVAGQAYYAVEGKKIDFSTAESALFFRCYRTPAFEATIESAGLVANTALLLTLLLTTPGMRWKTRSLYLGTSAALLYLSHVGFMITKVEVAFIAAQHPLAGSAAFWNFWDDFFETMGKQFFPIFIWLLLGMKYMLGAMDKPAIQAGRKPPGRNSPCSCGSGRKYKLCCGRA